MNIFEAKSDEQRSSSRWNSAASHIGRGVLDRLVLVTAALIGGSFLACIAAVAWGDRASTAREAQSPACEVLTTSDASALLGAKHVGREAQSWHPPHEVKVWTAVHKERTFRVIQLPRCEHLETVVTYNPNGETLKQAKSKLGGVVATTGSFHHPKTMALADFLQRDGSVLSPARTGRHFVSNGDGGKFEISGNYSLVRKRPSVTAMALGQRLVPLERDGFSLAFMNQVTDRMALGVNRNFIFVVQGKSDIWRLAHFMKTKLPVRSAVNSDGGHVVRGIAPVHVVFRWKTSSKTQAAHYVSQGG